MKKYCCKKTLLCLAVIGVVLTFSACSGNPFFPPAVTPLKKANDRLIGKWNNEAAGNDERDFTVFEVAGADYFTFECRINPGPKDPNNNPNYQGWGTATGKFTATSDENIYRMYELTGTGENGATWPDQLPGFNGNLLLIEFDDADTFTLESAPDEKGEADNPLVTTFFGGRYYRVP